MDTTAKWKDVKGKWVIFDMGTVVGHSRNHILALFGNKVPVVAKEGGVMITNDEGMYALYSKKGKVKRFTECQPSEKMFHSVGFLNAAI